MVKIDIKPLSVNLAWQGKRFKTKAYKQFEKDLLVLLPYLKISKTDKLTLTLRYGFSNKLSDIDNPTKLISDILCKKYGFDDRQIYELHQYKEIVKKGNDYFEFEIKPLS